MADDPNKLGRDFGDHLRDQIHQEVNDRIRARMERRLDRLERRRNRPYGSGGLIGGLILAGIGVLLLLDNLGILPVQDIWDYWPVILIVVGLSRAATACGWGGRVFGSALIFAGAVFLLHNLGYLHGDPWNFFWPVILIAVGMGMLARSLDHGGGGAAWIWPRDAAPPGATSSSSFNTLNEWAVFGGFRRRVESQEFEGGEALAMFGGINLDLTKAGSKKDEIRIDANAMFGGIDIRVPETWAVTLRGAGIFGGYEDKTLGPRAGEERKPRLIISGFAIFGGVVVKN